MNRFLLPMILMALAAGSVQAQQADPTYKDQIKVFYLENLEADAAAKMLKDVLGKSDGETFTVDPANNKLIANASPKRMALIETILAKLDEPPRNRPATLKVYKLKYSQAQEVMKVLSNLFISREDMEYVRLGVDEKLNAVVAHGPERAHSEIELLLESLDRPTNQDAEKFAKSLRFEVYWIADGEGTSPIPSEVAQVLSKQGKQLGITKPTVVASASTACYVESGSRNGLISFKNVKASNGAELDCETMISPLNDQSFKLDLRLSAGGELKTSIQTTIRTPLDHWVFVASTTTSGDTAQPTLFVLKVSDDDEVPKTPTADSPQRR